MLSLQINDIWTILRVKIRLFENLLSIYVIFLGQKVLMMKYERKYFCERVGKKKKNSPKFQKNTKFSFRWWGFLKPTFWCNFLCWFWIYFFQLMSHNQEKDILIWKYFLSHKAFSYITKPHVWKFQETTWKLVRENHY